MESIQKEIQNGPVESQPKKRITLTLCVIAKDSEETLPILLESIKPVVFDEVIVVDTGSVSEKTKEIAATFGAHVESWQDPDPEFFKKHGFISDFAKAREFSYSFAKSDYVMWLDSDDKLEGAELLRADLEAQIAAFGPNVAVLLRYLYKQDANGNVELDQSRIRITKNGSFYWKERVHEEILAKSDYFFSESKNPKICVIHQGVHDEAWGKKKNYRNRIIMEDELAKTGQLSARLWKYLAHCYEIDAELEDAIQAYRNYIEDSTWDEEIYLAKTSIANCMRRLGDFRGALKEDLEAYDMCPQFPQANVGLAATAMELRQYQKVLHYTDMAIASPRTTKHIYHSPKHFKYATWFLRYRAFFELGKHEEALQALSQIEKEFPDPNQYKDLLNFTKQGVSDAAIYRAFRLVAKSVADEMDPRKAEILLDAAPEKIKDFPDFAFLKRKKRPVTQTTVAIVCPGGGWSRSSIDKGIGGSEEAVILLSKELAALGLGVDVFLDSPEQGEFDGVRWYPYHALRPKDFYDYIVIWRWPELLDAQWNARKKFLWLHDVQFENRWSQERIENVDKIIFLSQFHRDGAPWIPNWKASISRNGLSEQYFAAPNNDPKTVIFTSNPTRGLETALEMWPEIHERTGAVLHTFYGFTELTRKAFSNNPLELRKMQRIEKMMKVTPGVENHGMVGQKELAQWNAKAGIWFYPTEFDEISCISAMRAQAHGAIPICTDFAALKETVQWGVKQPLVENWKEKIKETLIDYIQHPEKQEAIRGPMIEWARKQLLWKGVAEQWFQWMTGESWKENRTLPLPLEV